MFSFYGSKFKIVKKYPSPNRERLVEPFAGSAKYAYEYWETPSVILVDIYKPIVEVWKYLQEASPKDILSLPDVPNATKLVGIDGFNQLSQAEKWLIGFCCNGGSAQPKNVSGRHNFNSWNRDKARISKNLYKIKHWTIVEGNYYDVANEDATWFIDPPYVDKGKWYVNHDINYGELADWCKGRKGQVIVCENAGADWLDFDFLTEIHFSHFKTKEDKKKRTKEVVWYRENQNV